MQYVFAFFRICMGIICIAFLIFALIGIFVAPIGAYESASWHEIIIAILWLCLIGFGLLAPHQLLISRWKFSLQLFKVSSFSMALGIITGCYGVYDEYSNGTSTALLMWLILVIVSITIARQGLVIKLKEIEDQGHSSAHTD